MISNKDVISYLDKIMLSEIAMQKFYTDLAKQIKHPNYKKIILEMSKEEVEHQKIVQELIDTVKSLS